MAFKIFRKNCCGLDVHKTWIYACIRITDTNNCTEYKQARFSSSYNIFRCNLKRAPMKPLAMFCSKEKQKCRNGVSVANGVSTFYGENFHRSNIAYHTEM
jgi:hypothetical protein